MFEKEQKQTKRGEVWALLKRYTGDKEKIPFWTSMEAVVFSRLWPSPTFWPFPSGGIVRTRTSFFKFVVRHVVPLNPSDQRIRFFDALFVDNDVETNDDDDDDGVENDIAFETMGLTLATGELTLEMTFSKVSFLMRRWSPPSTNSVSATTLWTGFGRLWMAELVGFKCVRFFGCSNESLLSVNFAIFGKDCFTFTVAGLMVAASFNVDACFKA